MESNKEDLNENPSNRDDELEDQIESMEIDTSFETHFMKLEVILRNKNNRENILKQDTENLKIYKQILIDQIETLKKIQDKNQNKSLNIKYENQWRDKIIKRMIETHDKLKTITSSTNLVKNTIEFCENNQEKINKGKQQLLERISFNKENDDLKYEQLIHQDNLLSKEMDNEKLNMIKFEKKFKVEIDDTYHKINCKKQNINELKMKINQLKIQNELIDKKNNATVFDKNLILKEIDVVNFKLNTLQETIKKGRMEFDEKIKSLNGSIEKSNNCINNLKNNTDVIKQEINNEYKALNKMNYNKSELIQKLSNIELKHNSYNEKIGKLKEIYELDTKKYNTKINELKQEINNKQKVVIEMKNKNSILKEDHHLLVNQIMSLESNNNQCKLNIVKLNEDLKEKHFSFNEIENNFQNMVTKLKVDIQEKELNKNIENELEILEKQIVELNNKKENEKTNNENIFNEATTKERNLNLEIDKLNETKHMLENKNQEAETKIKEAIYKIEEDIQQAQEENNTKNKNLEEQTNIYQKEMERAHQVNEERRKQELDKLKEIDNNLKFKISECQMKKQDLDKELAVQIKELGKIREKKKMELKKKREHEFIEVAEQELNAEVLLTPMSEKQVPNKKMKLNNEELSNLKIPDSKYSYSSTSFSDSSICSLYSTTLQKQKQPRQTLPSEMFAGTRKSLDEIFNSLRDEITEITTKKPKSKKS